MNAIPDEYKDESAVIIARSLSYKIQTSSSFKITSYGDLYRTHSSTTIREKVKLNDKVAVTDFSTLEYVKLVDKSTSFGYFFKIKNRAATFIGIKIIKPNGKIVEQSGDEEILITDEKKRKEGKMAIADLEVGDILEYFIHIEEVREEEHKKTLYRFFLAEEHPVLHLSIRFQFGDNAGVVCKSANGAPEFIQSKGNKKANVIELKHKNLPKQKIVVWSRPLYQIPYIELRHLTTGRSKPYERGKIFDYITQEDKLKLWETGVGYRDAFLEKKFKDALKQNFGDKVNTANPDSIAKIIYYTWQHCYGYEFYPNSTLTTDCSINNHRVFNYVTLSSIKTLLESYGVQTEVFVVTPNNGPKLENALDYSDFEEILRTKSDKPIYFFMDNRFNTPYEIPFRYQGQDIMAQFSEMKKGNDVYTKYKTKLAISTAAENVLKETLAVSIKPDDINIILVDRTVAVTGYFKEAEQVRLCLPEESEKRQAQLLGVKDKVTELVEGKKTKKEAEEFQASFAAARLKWKDQFKDEITEHFGQSPKEVINYDIKNYALRYYDNSFVYNSSFSMDGFVKKGGNNYIFEAGKLVGIFAKVDEKERDRRIDVYMPCARTFDYTFIITVPDGYKAKGIETFNMNITNLSASFISTATQNGNIITITAKRIYKSAYEQVANWKNLLEVTDACYDFTRQKILFEKDK